MDFKTFLDLVIALETLDTKQSLQYFFRILDIIHCGKITPMSISYFYTDIQKGLQEGGWDAPILEDIRGEIYDMAGVNEADALLLSAVDTEVSTTLIVSAEGVINDNRCC